MRCHCKLGTSSGNAEFFGSLSIALEITPQGKPVLNLSTIVALFLKGFRLIGPPPFTSCANLKLAAGLFQEIASRICHQIFFPPDLNFPLLLGSERF